MVIFISAMRVGKWRADVELSTNASRFQRVLVWRPWTMEHFSVADEAVTGPHGKKLRLPPGLVGVTDQNIMVVLHEEEDT